MTAKKTTAKARPRRTSPAASTAHIPSIIDHHANALIDEAVAAATVHYREGRPGQGEFLLTHLGMRLTRLEAAAKGLEDALS